MIKYIKDVATSDNPEAIEHLPAIKLAYGSLYNQAIFSQTRNFVKPLLKKGRVDKMK
ncbi:MAG: hypothetical protein ICV79_23815 [Flavisolibacter sp.]|nr:hypothetical protein [Flavisolibacter sp.]